MNFIFKLFGWFFSNLLLILVVVAACYAFVYWDDPFGEDTPAGKVMAAFPEETEMVKSMVGKLMIAVDDSEPTVGSSETVVVTASDSGSVPAADSAASDAVSNGAASSDEASAASSDSAATDNVVRASDDDTAAVSEPVAVAPAIEPDERMQISAPEDESAFVSAEIEQELNQIKEDGSRRAVQDQAAASPIAEVPAETMPAAVSAPAASQVAATAATAVPQQQAADDSDQAKARQLMIDARKAYYRRDYDACISAYEQLISMQKDNFDALGELGNVYFNQGDMQKAADSYYQAATIMIAQGKGRRAASLVGFLQSVDEDKAASLIKSLEQGQQPPESL